VCGKPAREGPATACTVGFSRSMLFRPRFGRLGFAALGASALCGASAAALSPRPATVPLASTVCQPNLPTTVLVHGLDSSKETWSTVLGTLVSRGYPALALDLRGHGESPFGPPDDFSADALARDVWDAVVAHGIRGPVVLVGHSMGGRVAMRCATLSEASNEWRHEGAPPHLAAVIIEDMDLRVRAGNELVLAPGREDLKGWARAEGRLFASWEAAKKALLKWYPGQEGRVDSWKGKRVRPTAGGAWWSDLNPAAQHMARERVLASTDGFEAWDTLAARAKAANLAFPVHVWVADAPGTVCKWEGEGGIDGAPRRCTPAPLACASHGNLPRTRHANSPIARLVADMAARMPSCKVRKFEGAAHSIHNTAPTEYMQALIDVIGDAARAAAEDKA
jgi:pimeloyl-ACP methyl ester carboxylesterase